jgi:predicted DNA-binding transcriptional regulator YafY
MPKSSRLFEIIQLLRAAKVPLLAQGMAETLEVSKRTIYRDIATLQAMQTPIYGEAGVGYIMRKGYDLPPLNFDVDEAEAIAVGLNLIARTGDIGLWRAAGRAARKLNAAAPGTRRLLASSWGAEDIRTIDLAALRAAIRAEQKIALRYADAAGDVTTRTVWPFVLIYYVDTAMIAAWCELRQNIRHFRVDRVQDWSLLEDTFKGHSVGLLARWEDTQKADTVVTRQF